MPTDPERQAQDRTERARRRVLQSASSDDLPGAMFAASVAWSVSRRP